MPVMIQIVCSRRRGEPVALADAHRRQGAEPPRIARARFLGCAAAVVLAGCTTSQPRGPVSSSLAPPAPGPSSPSEGRPAHRTVALSCDASSAANAPRGKGNKTIDRLTFEGAAGDLAGSPPADVGLRVPHGPPLFFVKAPAYLMAGTAAITVELPARSVGYLAWVPAPIWTSGGGDIDLTRWMASRVVFHGCSRSASTFLGGFLSPDPHICLTVRVSQPSVSEKRQTVHLGTTSRC